MIYESNLHHLIIVYLMVANPSYILPLDVLMGGTFVPHLVDAAIGDTDLYELRIAAIIHISYNDIDIF